MTSIDRVIQTYEAASDYEITHAEAMQIVAGMFSDLTAAMTFGFVLWTIGMIAMMVSRGFLSEHHSSGNETKMPEIERYHGIIVAVGGINTKSLSLPDWDLSYVEFPPGQMREYRNALMKARVRIARVTDRRIYFEE
jgi:hypothetical protein